MDASVKEMEEELADSASYSSEDWQDLSKSDYAKVIFCNLYHDADNGEVGCKFQITDNVHEDPCDFVGLFKIGEPLCLVSKMLSETECEEDGKLLRCVFAYEDLPSDLQDGFYQFQYITRDQEICGASTPFEVKQAQSKEDSSDEEIVTESAENDFVLVQHVLEKKNRMLEQLLENFKAKNLALTSDLEALLETKSKLCQEKEEIIENLHQEILSQKTDIAKKQSLVDQKDADIGNLSTQLKNKVKAVAVTEKNLQTIAEAFSLCRIEKALLENNLQQLKQQKESLPSESEQRLLIEQLDDHKFMIRALEDSKMLALKEMNDLSESLTKRTKVLNQTRCELASSRGLLKEFDSKQRQLNEDISILRKKEKDLVCASEEKDKILKSKNEEISRLKEALNDLGKHLEEKEDKLKMTEEALASALTKHPACEVAEDNVMKLMANASKEIESYINLVDKIAKKVDFNDESQTQAFFDLKIMFFVLLSKMKKPTTMTDSKECHWKKVQLEKHTKKVSCTLPFCQTTNDMPNSVPEKSDKNLIQKENGMIVSLNKGVQVFSQLSVSQVNSAGWTPTPNPEKFPFHFETQKEIISNDLKSKLDSKYKALDGFKSAEGDFCEKIVSLNEEKMQAEQIVLDLKANIGDLQKKLCEAKDQCLTCKEENKTLRISTTSLQNEKASLLRHELLLQETLQEHEARIAEAAELYKKQFLEIKKLQKSLKQVQQQQSYKAHRLVSPHQVAEDESSSTAEDVSVYKISEKVPSQKRPKKANGKVAEKGFSPKVGYKPLFILKDFKKQAKKVVSAMPEKVVCAASESSSATKGTTVSIKDPRTASGSKTPSSVDVTWSTNTTKFFPSRKPKFVDLVTESDDGNSWSANWNKLMPSCKPKVADSVNENAACKTWSANLNKLSSPFTIDVVESTSDSAAENISSNTEKPVPLRSVNDSDTGEHVLRNAVLMSEGENKSNASLSNPTGGISEEDNCEQGSIENSASNDSLNQVEESVLLENVDLETVQMLFSEEVAKAMSTSGSYINDIEESYKIPCVLCNMPFLVTSLPDDNLTDHLERIHQINVCPVCGQLFDSSIPKYYLEIHVNGHF